MQKHIFKCQNNDATAIEILKVFQFVLSKGLFFFIVINYKKAFLSEKINLIPFFFESTQTIYCKN